MITKVLYTPGVEALSGQIVKMKGGLVYAENDNKAWNAPDGKQYARNMRPRIVLNVRKSDGSTYWGVRTKSCVNNTPTSRMRLAIFGGATAVFAAIQDPTLLANIYAHYETLKDNYKSFKSYAIKVISEGLKKKNNTFNFGGRVGAPVKVNNPWVDGGIGTDVTIADEILQKFALYLCPTQISVDGKVVAAYYGPSSARLAAFVGSKFNDGSFAVEGVEQEDYTYTYKGSALYTATGEVDFNTTIGAPLFTTAPNA